MVHQRKQFEHEADAGLDRMSELFEQPDAAPSKGPAHSSVRVFENVSRSFIDGYAQLVKTGFRPDTIGLAMLSATVNIYDMFEMRGVLPSALRNLAEKLENSAKLN